MDGKWMAAGCIALLLGGCGGGGTDQAPVPSTRPPPAPLPDPADRPVGTVRVTVVDVDGRPMRDASVTVMGLIRNGTTETARSDINGEVVFDRVPAYASRVYASHPFGTFRHDLTVVAGQTHGVGAQLEPARPVTVALLPVSVAADGVSADRTAIDVEISIVALPESFMVPGQSGAKDSPLLILDDCWIWSDPGAAPRCEYAGRGDALAVRYHYTSVGMPAPEADTAYAALLLMERGRRAHDDVHDLQLRAARQFVRRTRDLSAPGREHHVAVAGFAGQGHDAFHPPLLLPVRMWGSSGGSAPFSTATSTLLETVDDLATAGGGDAPLIAALTAAYERTAAVAPAGHRRAVVAMVGGHDDSLLPGSPPGEGHAQLAALQASAGVRTVLVVGSLEEASPERSRLGDLAAALRVPLIFSGHANEWSAFTVPDGQYAAVDLAARLLAGEPLPRIDATFRLRAPPGGSFQPGEAVRGTVQVESDQCPFDCVMLPLHFTAVVP